MPTYKIKHNGKLVDMPWNHPDPPSTYDIDKFLEAVDKPPEERGIIGRTWDKMNTPILDYDPQMRQRMNEFADANPVMGGAGRFFADAVASGTSPTSIGLEALTGGASLAAKFPRIANASRKVAKVAGGATAAHGAYKVGEGLYNSDPATALMGGVEALGGLAGFYANRKPISVKAAALDSTPAGPRDIHTMPPGQSVVDPPVSNRGLRLAAEGETYRPPSFFADDKGLVVPNISELGANGRPLDPLITAAYSNPPDVQPRGRSLDLGQYAEQRRQETLPGMSPNNWQRASEGKPVLPPVLSTVGDPPSRPLQAGDTSMSFGKSSNASLPYPLNITPEAVRPRQAQNVMDAIVPDRLKGTPAGEVLPSIEEPPQPRLGGQLSKIEEQSAKNVEAELKKNRGLASKIKGWNKEAKSKRPSLLGDERGALFPNRPRFGGTPTKSGVDAINEITSRTRPAAAPDGKVKVGGLNNPRHGDRILQEGEKVDFNKNQPRVFLFNSKTGEMLWGDKSDLHSVAAQNAGLTPKQFDQFDVHGRVRLNGAITYYRTNYNGDIAAATDINHKLMSSLRDRGLPPDTQVSYASGNRTLKDSINRVFTDEVGAVGDQRVIFDNPDAATIAKLEKKGYKFSGKDARGKSVFRFSKPEAKPIDTPAPAKADTPSPAPGNVTADLSSTRYKAIPDTATPEEAVMQWVRGNKAANFRGDLQAEGFNDLAGNTELMDKFEAGDRTGKLADVQKYHDAVREELVKIGVLTPDQKVPNYLRHEFEQNPEQVAEAVRKYYARNPSIAKERDFPTYKAAESAVGPDGKSLGLTRKFKDIPSAISGYEAKVNRTVRLKELYDYLDRKGLIAKKVNSEGKPYSTFSNDPKSWELIGPQGAEIRKLIKSATSEPNELTNKIGNVVSATKNIYLAGGIPGTKYNMHAINIARSDAKLRGVRSAAYEFFNPKDITGAASQKFLDANKHKIPELVEQGYTYHPVEDYGKAIRPEGVRGTVGKMFDKSQDLFERPLFEKALPALKLKRTLELIDELTPALGKERATREAIDLANKFYGGMETKLTLNVLGKKIANTKTNADLARIVFLAPDWLQSRLAIAKGDYLGAAKVIIGKGNAIDKIHAKSAARGAGMAVGTYGAKKLLEGNKKTEDSSASEFLSIPIGKDGNRTMRLSTMGTADEGVKLPLEAIFRMYDRNPAGILEALIANKLSTPANTAWNITHNQDRFKNPLFGKTKYGKDIPYDQGAFNFLNELTKPVQYQVVQGLLKWADGKASKKEVLAMAVEAPVTFTNDSPKKKAPARGLPRLRMPR